MPRGERRPAVGARPRTARAGRCQQRGNGGREPCRTTLSPSAGCWHGAPLFATASPPSAVVPGRQALQPGSAPARMRRPRWLPFPAPQSGHQKGEARPGAQSSLFAWHGWTGPRRPPRASPPPPHPKLPPYGARRKTPRRRDPQGSKSHAERERERESRSVKATGGVGRAVVKKGNDASPFTVVCVSLPHPLTQPRLPQPQLRTHTHSLPALVLPSRSPSLAFPTAGEFRCGCCTTQVVAV